MNMRATTTIAILLTSFVAVGLPLAVDGKPSVCIVQGKVPSAADQTAAQELATYLGRACGGTFAVVAESEPPPVDARIYVGSTAYAGSHGVDATALASEEWVIRTVGHDLILAGGGARGTLYAVYRFLEDVIGVHWWNPFEESVPKTPTIEIVDLDRRGKPVLRYRDIYMLYGNDGGRFAARNRLNRQGDTPILPELGGEMAYGPPYHVHTFSHYVPTVPCFAEHPEWFALVKGKRSAEQSQLCLTNPELRRLFVEKLKQNIATSHAAAKQEGRPVPTVFSISQNDCWGMCECDACQAIAKAEESEAGPLFDFINVLADAIRSEYPDVFIDTLAYMMTQKPPKSIKPRDSVIIRLCDTSSNFTKSITDPENTPFRETLTGWARIAKNLRIWDYAVTYGPYYGLPLPTVHTYPVDYQFYAEHNVEGVFTEHEYPILADLRDLKIWMMMKMLEDPYRDYEALLQQFMKGFYGPAGAPIRQYLARLEQASTAKSSFLSMDASPSKYRYLDLAFVLDAEKLFDEAEKAVGADPVLLRRVRHARLPLDRAAVVRYRELMDEWHRAGHDPKEMPLGRDAIGARYKDAWYAQIDLRIPPQGRDAERAEADAEVKRLLIRPATVNLPEQFRGVTPGRVFDYTADLTRNWNDVVKRVSDSEAETGLTNRLDVVGEDAPKYALPMPWGLYDQNTKRGVGSVVIRPEDVPSPGYHWYKMGSFPLTPSVYLYFFWSWIIQVDIGGAADPAHPDQPFEVWARIKFEGPAFPHGKPADKNAISVERVILVKVATS